jgi:hypothetical protein
MGFCGSCQRKPSPAPFAPLIEIHHGYRAEWNHLALSVESETSQWKLHVRDAAKNQMLYTAYRSDARAARVAAVEFAILLALGFASRVAPDRLAGELAWQEYW